MLQELPERRGELRPDAEDSHQAALLIDFDNVTMGIRSNLGAELRTLLDSDVIRGKVAVQRAYADWRRYPQYIVPLSEASIDLIFAPAYGSSKKNATDIRLAIDALELVFIRPEIRTYILMSGDSDFSSLVLKLKEYGKYVIGVGIQESSSDLLVQNCDEYYSYSALSGLSKTGDQPLESHDPWLLAGKAVERMVERGDTMRSDRLKQVMLEIDPSFNEKEQGFNKFNRFVVQAASRGLLSIQKMENGQYGVAPGEKGRKETKAGKVDEPEAKAAPRRRGKEKPKESKPARERQERKERQGPREKPQGEEVATHRARAKLTMKSALDLLHRALDVLLESGSEATRDSDVKRRMLELDPGFDEGELGFSKFSKFLQAAEEGGEVKLTRGPNGNYHVSRSQASKSRGGARQPEPDRGASTMKRLARFFFGGREGEEAEEEPAKPEKPVARRERGPRPPREGRPRREPSEGRSRRSGGGPRSETADRPPAQRSRTGARSGGRPERAEAGGRGGRGQRTEARGGERSGEARGGDRRRGERRPREDARRKPERARKDERPDEKPNETEVVVAETRSGSIAETPPSRQERSIEVAPEARSVEVAPKVAPEVVAEPEAGPEEREKQQSGAAAAPLPGAPRGTIRGRWGTRGRYRPSEAPPPIFAGQKGGRQAEEPAAREEARHEAEVSAGGESATALGRLKRYSGVGAKTAETLVEAFGEDLFKVLDHEPERLRDVLSEHRAERVLQARRKELETGSK